MLEGSGPFDAGRALCDLFIEDNGRDIRFVEGGQTREHFEDEDTESVPIDRLVVACVADDL